MKYKHNKKRNTAFLYEALVKELTRVSIKNKTAEKEKILSLIKKYFNKSTPMGEELQIYKTLYETRDVTKKQAEKILEEAKRVYFALNQEEIYNNQSKLVDTINKEVVAPVFNNFVSNYKNIASISQIFSKAAAIKTKVLLENQIVNRMSKKLEENVEAEEKISNTALKIFTKKFNKTYDSLLSEQKQLLNKYVSSFVDNGLELKIFLNEEITRLKKEITLSLELKEIKSDSEMEKKAGQVLERLASLKGQLIDKNILQKILKIQQLVKELKTND